MVTLLAAVGWACEQAYSAADLVGELTLAARDHAAPARAEAMLPCVTEPLGQADAALYHRVMAEAALRDDKGGVALAEMRAARAAFPANWDPPVMLAVLYARAEPEPGAPSAAIEESLVDGAPSTVLWLDRNSIVQRLEAGAWVTRYVGMVAAAEGPIARLGSGSAALIPPVRRQLEVGFREQPSLPLLVVGGTILLASGVGYGVHIYWRNRFVDIHDEEIDDQAELSAVGNVANAALFAGWGASAVGGGLMLGGAVKLRFE